MRREDCGASRALGSLRGAGGSSYSYPGLQKLLPFSKSLHRTRASRRLKKRLHARTHAAAPAQPELRVPSPQPQPRAYLLPAVCTSGDTERRRRRATASRLQGSAVGCWRHKVVFLACILANSFQSAKPEPVCHVRRAAAAVGTKHHHITSHHITSHHIASPRCWTFGELRPRMFHSRAWPDWSSLPRLSRRLGS